MSYYIARTVNRPFDAVMIGADIGRYRILGACNPRFAHEALLLEDKLGVLLPCNVIIREAADGRVEVASIDPVTAMERTGNPALTSTAEEVRRSLSEMLSRISG